MSGKPLSGREKAAVLLIALGPEQSANVLKHLRENEVEQLAKQIFSMEKVEDEVRREVMTECFEMALANRFISSGGFTYAQEMLMRAMGEEKTNDLIQRLAKSLRPQHFDFLKDTDPAQLASFIQDEQPQAIALILAHLNSHMSARVLASLPAELRVEVAMRIATMERTPPEVIEGVETVLRQRLSNIITSEYSSAGGVEALVKILGSVDRGTERVILEYLDRQSPELATEVRKQMFVFDNLVQLDDHSMQRILRDVDTRDLARALRGASEVLRELIFKNLSARAGEMLREDMAVGGPLRLQQVDEAQQKILTIVRQLDEAGEIVLTRGDDNVLV